jgi:hypothetical protein
MAGQGRHPHSKRRRQGAELREQGLSFRAIARRLGVTPQAAHQLFRYPQRPGLKCRGCGALVARDRDRARFAVHRDLVGPAPAQAVVDHLASHASAKWDHFAYLGKMVCDLVSAVLAGGLGPATG